MLVPRLSAVAARAAPPAATAAWRLWCRGAAASLRRSHTGGLLPPQSWPCSTPVCPQHPLPPRDRTPRLPAAIMPAKKAASKPAAKKAAAAKRKAEAALVEDSDAASSTSAGPPTKQRKTENGKKPAGTQTAAGKKPAAKKAANGKGARGRVVDESDATSESSDVSTSSSSSSTYSSSDSEASSSSFVSSSSVSSAAAAKAKKKKQPKPAGKKAAATKAAKGVAHEHPKDRPTREECRLTTEELAALHPSVVARNDDRRKTLLESCGMRSCVTDAIVSTMLSQNTTDANSKAAFKKLKDTFPTWEAVLAADVVDVENCIRVAGLAKVRAERIQQMLQTVSKEQGTPNLEYLRRLSDDDVKQELKRFKGLGPKTISCVLLFALGRDEFPVDTHVLRITQTLGWVGAAATRETAYDHLNKTVPNDVKLDLHCLLVTHGKHCHVCAANNKPQFPPEDGSVLHCPLRERYGLPAPKGIVTKAKVTAEKKAPRSVDAAKSKQEKQPPAGKGKQDGKVDAKSGKKMPAPSKKKN